MDAATEIVPFHLDSFEVTFLTDIAQCTMVMLTVQKIENILSPYIALTWFAEAGPGIFGGSHPGTPVKLPLPLSGPFTRAGDKHQTHLVRILTSQRITLLRSEKILHLWSPRTALAPKYLFSSVSGFRFLGHNSKPFGMIQLYCRQQSTHMA